jgi:hypothetical protein
MGRACLCGDGHHWSDRGSGCVAAGGRQQGGLSRQPDAARADARSHVLRAGGDPDTLRLGAAEEQPDAVPDANPNPDDLGEHLSDRDRQWLGDTVSFAGCYRDGITLVRCQRDALGLALNATRSP